MADKAAEPRFFNRELSWLAFNERVLEEALDSGQPLLERLKFLAITANNLDEFFMVRAGGIQILVEEGDKEPEPSGLVPKEQLAAISARAHAMAERQYACFLDDLEPGMKQSGIRRLTIDELTPQLHDHIRGVFEHDVYPVVSSVAVDSAQDLPMLQGLGVHLAVRLKPASADTRKARYAIVSIPRRLPRFITLPVEQGHNYMLIEDIAGAFVDQIFPGEPVAEWAPFRITRNAGMSVREEQAEDLLESMKEVLDARRQASCVRLEIADRVSKTMLSFLQSALKVHDQDVYAIRGPLDLSSYMSMARMAGFDDLRDKPWPPQPHPAVPANRPIFELLAEKDILLHQPYDSFDPVVRFLEEAADDPDVLAIKQILYRTSEKSPIVAALARAASRDKHVTVIVELKARFDEARNIGWAEELEQTGVQVIYGLRGFKTHAKICVVVRREPGGIRRYVHFGTGNYNEITARLYTDVSYMTCREDYGADATAFFNMITGYSQPVKFRKIESAPIGLRARLLELIESETQRAQQKQKAAITARFNSLVDPHVIEALYRASRAGVKIDLNVRGICCLRPGVPGLSENIRVVSIVDRFLEHSRILRFRHGGADLVFISSADWMTRNLDRRVELLVPVDDDDAKARLVDILDTAFRDNVKARVLQPDGTYQRLKPGDGEKALRSQEFLYRQACEAARREQKKSHVVFEPQRPVTRV